jgi:hypothetical protein
MRLIGFKKGKPLRSCKGEFYSGLYGKEKKWARKITNNVFRNQVKQSIKKGWYEIPIVMHTCGWLTW